MQPTPPPTERDSPQAQPRIGSGEGAASALETLMRRQRQEHHEHLINEILRKAQERRDSAP